MIRKTVTAGLSLSVAATGLLLAGPAGATAPVAAAAARLTPTHYAMGGSGYSTRLSGGDLHIGSNRTAFAVIGCTNKAGIDKGNAEADVRPGDLLDVQAATTRVRTTSRNGTVAITARNSIAKVVLGTTSISPTINGISSTSRAYHNRTGFHASTRTRVLSVDLDGTGPTPAVAGPTRGNPIDIPGIATIALGRSSRSHGPNGANAQAEALRITLAVTGQQIFLAHTRATIGRGVKSALFSGRAYGSKADLLDGTVASGPTPLIVMPCQGTKGVRHSRSIVFADPVTRVHARALTVSQSADATRSGATAYEQAHIARVNLGHNLVIKGINAKAMATRDRSGLHTSARGTSVARILLNGTRLAIPANGVVRVRGIARIETKVVKQIKGGISVIGARVTLLDKRTAVVTLAAAMVRIRPSGL
jgi:hypothetical protein